MENREDEVNCVRGDGGLRGSGRSLMKRYKWHGILCSWHFSTQTVSRSSPVVSDELPDDGTDDALDLIAPHVRATGAVGDDPDSSRSTDAGGGSRLAKERSLRPPALDEGGCPPEPPAPPCKGLRPVAALAFPFCNACPCAGPSSPNGVSLTVPRWWQNPIHRRRLALNQRRPALNRRRLTVNRR